MTTLRCWKKKPANIQFYLQQKCSSKYENKIMTFSDQKKKKPQTVANIMCYWWKDGQINGIRQKVQKYTHRYTAKWLLIKMSNSVGEEKCPPRMVLEQLGIHTGMKRPQLLHYSVCENQFEMDHKLKHKG